MTLREGGSGLSAGRHEAGLVGHYDGLCAVTQAQFGQDALDVGPGGLPGDAQGLADLRVGHALGNQHEHFRFPAGQHVEADRDGRDGAGAYDTLFLGLGAVALLVGAVGVANIMIISVLERRQEIGLRRALGATRGQIRIQFLSEAILLSLIGGAVGVILGVISTAVYGHTKGWPLVIPAEAWAGGLGAALAIGAVAGLLPAIRAARLSPTQALWSL